MIPVIRFPANIKDREKMYKMKKTKSIHSGTPDLRLKIIGNALSCFIEKGYAAAGIGDVCERSKVSVGSLYHHFKSKEQLARSVYMEGIRNYQAGFAAGLPVSSPAKEGIFHIVTYHLRWVRDHPDWAKFLFQYRHAEFMRDTEDDFKKMNSEFNNAVGSWFARRIKAGELRPLPPEVYFCLLLGPCQEFSRIYLFDETCTDIDTAGRSIAAALWDAVGGDTGGEAVPV